MLLCQCHPTHNSSTHLYVKHFNDGWKKLQCTGVRVITCHAFSNLYGSAKQKHSILECSIVSLDRNWVQTKSLVFREGVGKQSILNLRVRWKSKATEPRINTLKDIIHKMYCLVNCVSLASFQLDLIQICWRQQLWNKFLVFGKTAFHGFDFPSLLSS